MKHIEQKYVIMSDEGIFLYYVPKGYGTTYKFGTDFSKARTFNNKSAASNSKWYIDRGKNYLKNMEIIPIRVTYELLEEKT